MKYLQLIHEFPFVVREPCVILLEEIIIKKKSTFKTIYLHYLTFSSGNKLKDTTNHPGVVNVSVGLEQKSAKIKDAYDETVLLSLYLSLKVRCKNKVNIRS